MELEDIKGVGSKTVESLNNNGIQTVEDLANASIEDISNAGMSTSRAKDVKYKAKQNTIESQSLFELEEENKQKRSISSGINSLDEYTNGGFSDGEIVAVYGSDGSGKTQLCFQILVEAAQEYDEPVIYVETERNRLQAQRLRNMADNEEALDNVYRVKAYDLESQLQSYNKIIEDYDKVAMVVVDSLTANFRLSEKFDDRSKLSARSTELGKHINKMGNMVDRKKCPCILTNQVYNAPTQYDAGDNMWGGSLLKHSVLYRLYMKKSSGETHEVTVEQHPSTGNNSFHINIDESGVREV